jgi:hypothetical protein
MNRRTKTVAIRAGVDHAVAVSTPVDPTPLTGPADLASRSLDLRRMLSDPDVGECALSPGLRLGRGADAEGELTRAASVPIQLPVAVLAS